MFYYSACALARTGSVEVLREPAEALAVALALRDAAHEDLDGADAVEGDGALPRGALEPERLAQLLLGHRTGQVDLVPEHQEGRLRERLGRQQVLWGHK